MIIEGKNDKLVRELMPYGKVLVVDDVCVNIEIVKLLLIPYELQIDESESGFDAIDKINSGKEYDIIFMDNMMPKMDGYETTVKLRELGYNLPVVALSANKVAENEIGEDGFDEYLAKPINIRELDDILNRYVRDKHKPS